MACARTVCVGIVITAGPVLSQTTAPWTPVVAATVSNSSVPGGLTTIGGVTIDQASGALYISQPQDHRILVFTPAGALRDSIGRAGDGPGEFRRLSRLSWIADTLVAHDGRRAHLFTRDGTVIRTLTFPGITVLEGDPSAAVAAVLRNGSYLVSSSMGRREIAANTRVFSIADSTGRVTRNVVRTAVPRGLLYIGGTLLFNERLEDLFGDGTVVQAAPDGAFIAVVDRSATPDRNRRVPVSITKLKLNGDTVWRTVLQLPTQPVPRQLSDSVIAVMSANVARGGSAGTVRNAIRIPRFMPAVTAVHAGMDGTIWIRSATVTPDGAVWSIVDASGRSSSSTLLPRRARVVQADRTGFWTSELDDDDLPLLRRYRIP